jgi:hypothetical protein
VVPALCGGEDLGGRRHCYRSSAGESRGEEWRAWLRGVSWRRSTSPAGESGWSEGFPFREGLELLFCGLS